MRTTLLFYIYGSWVRVRELSMEGVGDQFPHLLRILQWEKFFKQKNQFRTSTRSALLVSGRNRSKQFAAFSPSLQFTWVEKHRSWKHFQTLRKKLPKYPPILLRARFQAYLGESCIGKRGASAGGRLLMIKI